MLYLYQNTTSVKEELAQHNGIYKLIVQVSDEMTEVDVSYSEELWLAEIDKKIPSNINFTIG